MEANAPMADHVSQHWKKYTAGGLIAAVIILIIIVAWFMFDDGKDKFWGGYASVTSPTSNLINGGNNPMWNMQRGDAGWGGSMHSTYQDGQQRIWGASAEGPNDFGVQNNPYQSCASQSYIGAEEAQAMGPRNGLGAVGYGADPSALSDHALGQQMMGY